MKYLSILVIIAAAALLAPCGLQADGCAPPCVVNVVTPICPAPVAPLGPCCERSPLFPAAPVVTAPIIVAPVIPIAAQAQCTPAPLAPMPMPQKVTK